MRNGLRFGTVALVGALSVAACADEPTTTATDIPTALSRVNRSGKVLKLDGNRSVTPPLVRMAAGFEEVEALSIISSDDVLDGSPDFQFGGSADGAGLLVNEDGTYTFITNHEDNFSVSRITLDEEFRPVAGEYLLDSDVGQWRLCSATLVTPEEHGFDQPYFITAGESGIESQIHQVDPYGPVGQTTLLDAFGKWSTENAVPLPRTAYNRQTVVVLGDDDSGSGGGQIAMYVGPQGDLASGDLYVLKRVDGDQREMNMVAGETYAVEFVRIANPESKTGGEIDAESVALGAMQFGRVEDLDYRKSGPGRDIYFNVTGQGPSRANAPDALGTPPRTVKGRTYRLSLDPRSPLRGELEVILDGDDLSGPAALFQNPDNILVTRNYAYIQEDPNGYGTETHDAYIYQYNLNTGELKVVMELDHNRDGSRSDYEDYYNGDLGRLGSWEYGAMLDVTDKLGGSGSSGTFLLNIQPHTWRGDAYVNPDGGSRRPSENQASQMILVRGLPR